MSLLQQLQSGRFVNWLISSVAVSPELLLLKSTILDRVAFARLDQFSRLTDPSAVKADDSDSILVSRWSFSLVRSSARGR